MRVLQYLFVLAAGICIGWCLPSWTAPANSRQVTFPAAPGSRAALVTWERPGVFGATAALPVQGQFRAWIPKDQKYSVRIYQ